MELFSVPWWSALLAIILIDLVLAGDNAIVIALAARNLPPEHQNKAIVWGTVGAIVVRSAMTVGVVWLLKIPGLMLVGGLGLLWIAYKLISDTSEDEHEGGGATTFWGAMKTIVVADALMGVDNVLGVAGAANGSFDLVVIGLLISIPIVVLGSKLVLRLVEKWPVIIHLGAAVLAFTAAQMIINEKLLDPVFDGGETINHLARGATYILAIAGVLGTGWLATRKQVQEETETQSI
jgi:YjbE family integral membrane protein